MLLSVPYERALTYIDADGVYLSLPMVINGHRCHDVIGSLTRENELTNLGEDHEVDLELLKPAVTAQAVTLQGTYYTVVYYIQPVSLTPVFLTRQLTSFDIASCHRTREAPSPRYL